MLYLYQIARIVLFNHFLKDEKMDEWLKFIFVEELFYIFLLISVILDNGNKAYSFKLDVTDREAVYKLGDKIRNEIGDVSMLINNAGIVTGRKFMECSDALMQKTVEVNTISHFWVGFIISLVKLI